MFSSWCWHMHFSFLPVLMFSLLSLRFCTKQKITSPTKPLHSCGIPILLQYRLQAALWRNETGDKPCCFLSFRLSSKYRTCRQQYKQIQKKEDEKSAGKAYRGISNHLHGLATCISQSINIALLSNTGIIK